jgi:hypothetical protein
VKRHILAIICFLALAVSCTQTPEQQVVFTTATPWIVTATSASMDTPTPTATPTATALPIATATVVPPTVAPTEVSKGKVIFSADFNGGIGPGWDVGGRIRTNGTKVEFVPDPTGSPNQVMKITVTGPPEEMPPQWGTGKERWLNSYPAWENEKRIHVSAIEVQFWYPPDFVGDVGLLSAHGTNERRDVTGVIMAPSRSIVCLTRITTGNEIYFKTGTKIAPNMWHTLRIEYNSNQTVFIVDDKVVHTADFKFQALDAHAGFQWAGDEEKMKTNSLPPVGAWIMQRNFRVEIQ